MHQSQTTCRICNHSDLRPVLSLGETPLADRLLSSAMLKQDEPAYPLSVYFCPHCSLMQISETVSPEKLFCEDYPYYSSFSPALLKHSKNNAEQLIKNQSLRLNSLVVELASNDGYMLKNFMEQGIPVLGIDPAEGPARVAQEAGVPTMCTFFNRGLANDLLKQGQQADVIIANNVLAHVPDQNEFVEGIRILLKDSGTAVIEVPYVRDLIENCEFDTIYHEHLCYFSVTALTHLFKRHGMWINHIDQVPIHGGSLRVFASKTEDMDESVQSLLNDEAKAGMDQFAYYQNFARQVEHVRHALLALMGQLKTQGKRIAAYGAAAKGATLINYIGIGTGLVDFVVDRNTHKHGKYMPGQHLPIYPCEHLLKARPDYVLLLAWNFAEEIIQQQADYLRRGGAFIVPVPSPQVIKTEPSPAGQPS